MQEGYYNVKEKGSTYFGAVAEEWDQLRAGYFSDRVREAAIAALDLTPDMIVADIGAGTGFMLEELAPRVRRLYGLDATFEMLAVARRHRALPPSTLLVQAEGRFLPLPSGTLDAITANMYLHHCPDPLEAIREMVRLLKSGGRVAITDMDRHDHDWMRTEMADLWLGFSRDQVRHWLELSGLADCSVDCTDEDCCATSDEGVAAQISIFVASGRRQ